MQNKIGILELELYTKTLVINIQNAIKVKDKKILKSHKIFFKWLRIKRK